MIWCTLDLSFLSSLCLGASIPWLLSFFHFFPSLLRSPSLVLFLSILSSSFIASLPHPINHHRRFPSLHHLYHCRIFPILCSSFSCQFLSPSWFSLSPVGAPSSAIVQTSSSRGLRFFPLKLPTTVVVSYSLSLYLVSCFWEVNRHRLFLYWYWKN